MIRYCCSAMSMMGMLLSSVYIFGKAINHAWSAKQKGLAVLWCFVWAMFSASDPSWMPVLLMRPVICAAFVAFVWKLLGVKWDTAVSAYLLSYGIGYSFLYVATLLIGLGFAPVLSAGHSEDTLFDFSEPIYLPIALLIVALQFFLTYRMFRVRRFKRGFPFLFERYAVIWALVAAGIVWALVSWISMPREHYGNHYGFLTLIAGVLIVGFGIIVWIRRGIKTFYHKKMVERSIEQLEQELAEKTLEIERMDALRVANHKINRRLAALESGVAALIQKHSLEISGELSVALEDITRLSQDYQDEVAQIKWEKPLTSTNVPMIDHLFRHFLAQCEENKISFDLVVNGSIAYITDRIVPQGKLETLIGDHLQDALVAVQASGNPFRSILVMLGAAESGYVFMVSDSGIPFEIDILARLGTERVTTHDDIGGSGIGFMTTFETLQECGASLMISEKQPSAADYTKSVTIRFDKKNQYIIETYRPDAFPPSDRYMIMSK